MRFMLRCIFWLSFVYASILSNAGFHIGAIERDDLATTARAAINAPVKAAATGLSTYCRRDPAACLADSARLSELVTASDGDGAGRDDGRAPSRRPDPRHRARGAVQAQMP